MLMTDRIFARLLYRELLDGDEARIAALSRTVLQKPFHSIVAAVRKGRLDVPAREVALSLVGRSEEHTSELQSLMRISYAVFCLKKTMKIQQNQHRVHSIINTTL